MEDLAWWLDTSSPPSVHRWVWLALRVCRFLFWGRVFNSFAPTKLVTICLSDCNVRIKCLIHTYFKTSNVNSGSVSHFGSQQMSSISSFVSLLSTVKPLSSLPVLTLASVLGIKSNISNCQTSHDTTLKNDMSHAFSVRGDTEENLNQHHRCRQFLEPKVASSGAEQLRIGETSTTINRVYLLTFINNTRSIISRALY